MPKEKLSLRQQNILDYIKDQIATRGFPPSVRDICDAVGLKSTSSVHAHLETLEHKGYIRRDPTKPRAIEIMDSSFYSAKTSVANIPVIGQVAAGEPLLAEENIEGFFPIPEGHLPPGEAFMLKIRGDSMINAGILNGDMVLVERKETASDGEIVVALIDDSATVKTFYKEKDTFRLQPENDALEPIFSKDLRIMGKVVGVFRFLQ